MHKIKAFCAVLALVLLISIGLVACSSNSSPHPRLRPNHRTAKQAPRPIRATTQHQMEEILTRIPQMYRLFNCQGWLMFICPALRHWRLNLPRVLKP